MMIYRVFSPAPHLRDLVDHYWYTPMDLTAAVVQHYPTPLLQGMAFNFSKKPEYHTYNEQTRCLDSQAYLFGQPVSSRMITTNKSGVDLLGVKFRPLGMARITGIHMEQMTDQIISADEVWGRELELLCDEMQSAPTLAGSIQVLENFFTRKLQRIAWHYRSDSVSNAVELIRRSGGTLSIKALQQETNTSRKTLERAFLRYHGLHPKLYSEIVRFNAIKQMMDTAPELSVSDLAFGLGYYDNSHMSASFKRFSGLTPTDYMATVRMERLKNSHFRENTGDGSL